jgi:hypothetical protein
MEIVTGCGIEVSAYATPAPYQEFEDDAVAREINGPEGCLRGSLDDPDFLRQLADLIEKAQDDERAQALHLDVD